MMLSQRPLSFALSERCFVCLAPPGEQCRSDSGEPRMYPHFGRVGMPTSRGWSLRMTALGPMAIRMDAS
jgi:hypothetical protein